MRMNTSLVVALGAGMAVSCFAGERNAPQRQVKSADTSAVGELDYSSIVLDEEITVTIVSEADGRIFDVQTLLVDGEEAVMVSMLAQQELTQVRKVPQSIDTALKYQSLLVDDGLTATMVSDANGNLIGATVSLFDGDVVTTSSTSDNSVIMATKDLRIISVGDVAVALRLDETTGQWDTGAIIDMPLAVTDVATNDTDGNAPDAATCTVTVSPINDCTVAAAVACGSSVTLYIVCRENRSGTCQGDWRICGKIDLN